MDTNISAMASSSSMFISIVILSLLASWQATAYDPSPLQDFCVADMNSPGIYMYAYGVPMSVPLMF